jgi:hypothetical protein
MRDKPDLMDKCYVKLLNKPFLKGLTLIDTPGFTLDNWRRLEPYLELFGLYSTKVLFLVNDMHSGSNQQASKLLPPLSCVYLWWLYLRSDGVSH